MPHPTRIADDVFESARIEGERDGRSTAEQVNHWARIGREVSIHESAARSRVEATLAGKLSADDLDDAEARVYNAELRVAIRERLSTIDFTATLAQRGIVTVSLDDEGRMVEHHPDGTQRIVAEARTK
ncbi:MULTISPECIES: TA system antitoxin ParD family protein [Tsukamurella]|uniref:ParD-like family protein n=2 Tax=Tsukamurella TaxID=2060 RepID=A0A846X894_9ACTN|nr:MULTISPECIES: hypothetical protein [Tsukamurella]KXP14495.1 hypothetical protein AXK60_00865 [Tsukamurella pseudospumae]NKY19950.1 hypothetical protein [Tsukamurella spumae]